MPPYTLKLVKRAIDDLQRLLLAGFASEVHVSDHKTGNLYAVASEKTVFPILGLRILQIESLAFSWGGGGLI
jgi:hypothetical protein